MNHRILKIFPFSERLKKICRLRENMLTLRALVDLLEKEANQDQRGMLVRTLLIEVHAFFLELCLGSSTNPGAELLTEMESQRRYLGRVAQYSQSVTQKEAILMYTHEMQELADCLRDAPKRFRSLLEEDALLKQVRQRLAGRSNGHILDMEPVFFFGRQRQEYLSEWGTKLVRSFSDMDRAAEMIAKLYLTTTDLTSCRTEKGRWVVDLPHQQKNISALVIGLDRQKVEMGFVPHIAGNRYQVMITFLNLTKKGMHRVTNPVDFWMAVPPY